jgi:hypothetical protein
VNRARGEWTPLHASVCVPCRGFQLRRLSILSRSLVPLVEQPDHLHRVEGGRFAFCVPLAQLLGRLAHERAQLGQKEGFRRRRQAYLFPFGIVSFREGCVRQPDR